MIQKQLLTKKTFTYSKGEVSLNFELLEKKEYFKDFIRLLEEATKDIKDLLNK